MIFFFPPPSHLYTLQLDIIWTLFFFSFSCRCISYCSNLTIIKSIVRIVVKKNKQTRDLGNAWWYLKRASAVLKRGERVGTNELSVRAKQKGKNHASITYYRCPSTATSCRQLSILPNFAVSCSGGGVPGSCAGIIIAGAIGGPKKPDAIIDGVPKIIDW